MTQGLGALLDEVDSSGKFQTSTMDNLEKAMKGVDGTIQTSSDKQLASDKKLDSMQSEVQSRVLKIAQRNLSGGGKGGFMTPSNVKKIGGAIGGLAGGKGKKMGGAGLAARGGGKGKGDKFGIVTMVGFDDLAESAKDTAKDLEESGKDSAKDLTKSAKVTIASSKDTAKDAPSILEKLKEAADARMKDPNWQVAMRSPSPVAGGTGMQEAKPAIAASSAATQNESFKMTVEGEMTVKFDSAMFKNQVTSIVATVVKSPEIAKSIQSMVYGQDLHA